MTRLVGGRAHVGRAGHVTRRSVPGRHRDQVLTGAAVKRPVTKHLRASCSHAQNRGDDQPPRQFLAASWHEVLAVAVYLRYEARYAYCWL